MSSKPSCINLPDPRQVAKWEKFQEFINTQPGRYAEEDCCGTSSYTWIAISSGIGDCLTVEAMGYSCSLAIDDDNQLSEGWEKVQ